MDAETQAREDRAAATEQPDLWALGDVSQFDVATTIVAELLCEGIDLRPGQAVLDVATGSGNAAVAAARRGCRPLAINSDPARLERARERARAERLRARFQFGDLEAIPFPDASFDVVLSVFGAMFAPDQHKIAGELLRVCRSGGVIGLANWAEDGLIGTIIQTTAQHAPGVRGLPNPAAWGTEQGMRGLLGQRVRSLEVRQRTFIFRCPSPEAFLELLGTHDSPALSVLPVLDLPGRHALQQTLIAAVRRFNRADDGTMVVAANYLEIIAIKR